MTAPDAQRCFRALDATWPAASVRRTGPWRVREGAGGGQRVSAVTADGAFAEDEIRSAEAAARGLGQKPLFMVRPGEQDLDACLARSDYTIVDPVHIYVAPVARIAKDLPPTVAIPSWPPLAIQLDIWADAGIGAGRIGVMERAGDPKTTILGRLGHAPAAAAFVAADGEVAMLHALEVRPDAHRRGVGRNMMAAAARWAHDAGALWMAVAVTKANAPANALYRSMGMTAAAEYYYRRAS